MSKRAYAVLSPVEYDRRYEPGEEIALDPAEAEDLVEAGVICDPDDPRAASAGTEPVDEASAGIFEQALDALRKAPAEEVAAFFRRVSEDPEIRAKAEAAHSRQERLIAAIGGLEKGNEAHWTNTGKPEVRALREATGLDDVSAAERDAVWEELRKAKGAE